MTRIMRIGRLVTRKGGLKRRVLKREIDFLPRVHEKIVIDDDPATSPLRDASHSEHVNVQYTQSTIKHSLLPI